MPIEVHGLKELRAALREAAAASPREVRTALLEGAKEVAELSNRYAPRGQTGKLSSNGKAFATQTKAGVRYNLIYAGVQEFADHVWLRRSRGSGTSVTRSMKNYHKHGGTVSGADPVDYTGLPPTPRFAFKAVNELGPKLVDQTFTALTDILKAHGWFVEG